MSEIKWNRPLRIKGSKRPLRLDFQGINVYVVSTIENREVGDDLQLVLTHEGCLWGHAHISPVIENTPPDILPQVGDVWASVNCLSDTKPNVIFVCKQPDGKLGYVWAKSSKISPEDALGSPMVHGSNYGWKLLFRNGKPFDEEAI